MTMSVSQDSVSAFEQLREQLPVALIEVEWPTARVTYLNAIAQTLSGYNDEDVARGVSGLCLLDEPSQRQVLAIAQEQLASNVALGLPYQRLKGQRIYELTAIRKDGTHYPVELQAAYILDDAHFPVGIRFIFRDLTERHRLEEERRQLELQARQSQKLESLGILAGGIAHNINNLLTAVHGNLFLLRHYLGGNTDALEVVDELEVASDRGAQMVRSLVQFWRPELAASGLTDLAQLIRDTAELVRPSIPPATHLALEDLPEGRLVHGDSGALAQVLVNLLVNAIDATAGSGRITVSLSRVCLRSERRWAPPGFPAGPYHLVSIADTGPGIAPEVQEQIFDPYFSTKDVRLGRGLGLSISLSIACSHGGWLSVESTPGKGATFHLLLPDACGQKSASEPHSL